MELNADGDDDDDECRITGAVVLQPCVPVTGVEGTGESYIVTDFNITSVDESISINFSGNRLNPPDSSYTFTNTQNRPNCPATDQGTISWTTIE